MTHEPAEKRERRARAEKFCRARHGKAWDRRPEEEDGRSNIEDWENWREEELDKTLTALAALDAPHPADSDTRDRALEDEQKARETFWKIYKQSQGQNWVDSIDLALTCALKSRPQSLAVTEGMVERAWSVVSGHVFINAYPEAGKRILQRALEAALTPEPPKTEEGMKMETDELVKHMVDRFLGWKLPEDFHPDAGISFKKTYNEHTPHPAKHEPTGTNLFGADQAKAMVEYLLEGAG